MDRRVVIGSKISWMGSFNIGVSFIAKDLSLKIRTRTFLDYVSISRVERQPGVNSWGKALGGACNKTTVWPMLQNVDKNFLIFQSENLWKTFDNYSNFTVLFGTRFLYFVNPFPGLFCLQLDFGKSTYFYKISIIYYLSKGMLLTKLSSEKANLKNWLLPQMKSLHRLLNW